MTTAKHTPGPWKAVYSEYGEEIWFGGNDGPGMWEIEGAEAYLPGDHDEQARLIAAAPDLLTALRATVACLRGFNASADFGPLDDEAVSAGLAVLARIDGQDVP